MKMLPIMANPEPFQSVFITGASSGIGAALAIAYAAPGVHLHLCARSEAALEHVAGQCTAKGARCHVIAADVTDDDAMRRRMAEADATAPLDLVVANAGISAGTGGTDEPADQVRAIFKTNVGGVLNTVLPAVWVMERRGRGQIGIMSSLAGFRGMGGAPAYAASKAAVKSWGEGLRQSVAAKGIGVSVICPGFVESNITAANDFPMPFFMPADKAAEIIKRGLRRNRGRIAFPWPMVFAAWAIDGLPDRLAGWITAHLPHKSRTGGGR